MDAGEKQAERHADLIAMMRLFGFLLISRPNGIDPMKWSQGTRATRNAIGHRYVSTGYQSDIDRTIRMAMFR
jgi:hypothetical protein